MITVLTITDFIGRLHPLLVHLPVGILLLSVVFHLLCYKKKFELLQPAVKISLLLGMLAAIASCISGYILANSGDYETALVNRHQWFGIGLAIVAIAAYYFTSKNAIIVKWIMPLLALLIFITGHLGGSLTHGAGYLTQSTSSKEKATIDKAIPDVQQAVAYNDLIKPILSSNCYNCHGANKQKGKLRLDETVFIDKGGEDGKVIIAGNAGESELIKRLLLPADNDDHMPPKEKPQLTKSQIAMLNWWVSSGADYHKKVAELKQPENIKSVLAALQGGGEKSNINAIADIPEKPVEKAPANVIEKLKALDVAVTPVSQNSNYLQVNFVAVEAISAQHLQLLHTLNKQITWLKIGRLNLNDSAMALIGRLTNLTRLFLDKTNISDQQIGYLKSLSQLQYLNLSGTAVTASGLSVLKGLNHLKSIFLYQDNISAAGLSTLQKTFSKTSIDTGGYAVAFLPTDTVVVKEKNIKK